jgi:hypothetical protein
MVLFDLPMEALRILLEGAKKLKNLSLVADRNLIPALVAGNRLHSFSRVLPVQSY